jgi:glyoxylase-like metal-dependent hydrolase (beta-lactamase superfamily II)
MFEAVTLAEDLTQLRVRARGWPSACNVYLIRDGAGVVVVDAGLGVDPGFSALLHAMRDALKRWSRTLGDVHTIVLTHTHTDHAGGTIPLARATGARVVVPARGWAQASDPWWQVHHILPPEVRAELGKYRDFDVALHFRVETMPELFSEALGIVWERVDEGHEIAVGAYRLKAFHTPGHDVAHLAWVDLARGLGFTGDLLVARGTSLPWYPPNAGGIAGYLHSLERLGGLPLQLVCPGHQDVCRGRAESVALCQRTVSIVLDRQRRLLDALLRSPATFGELDDLIYDPAVRDVIPWASSVTMAHIRDLEQRGLLTRRDDGRYATWPVAAERDLESLRMRMAATRGANSQTTG